MNKITRKEPKYAKIRAIGYFRKYNVFRMSVEKYINRTRKRNKHYTYINKGGKR